MKLATTAKLPKKTAVKVNDPDNPAWTQGMLGAPVLTRGRGLQAKPTKVFTSLRLDFSSGCKSRQTRHNHVIPP
jgi:hypothetical protein